MGTTTLEKSRENAAAQANRVDVARDAVKKGEKTLNEYKQVKSSDVVLDFNNKFWCCRSCTRKSVGGFPYCDAEEQPGKGCCMDEVEGCGDFEKVSASMATAKEEYDYIVRFQQ